MLIIIVVLLLIFGGGFGGYYGYNRYGPRGGSGIIGLVILIILLVRLFGGGGFHCTISLPLKSAGFGQGRALKSKTTPVGFWLGRVKGSFDPRVGFLSHSSHVF
jgi:hypothetical protein